MLNIIIIVEIVTINKYGIIGELDINSITEKTISKNENSIELLIKIE